MKLIVWLEVKCNCKIKGKNNQQHGTWSDDSITLDNQCQRQRMNRGQKD
jgi:hypothetical protein